MRAVLMPLEGGAVVELAKDLVLVGRAEECDLRIDHKSVSKQHCVLVKTDGLVLVRDLGSTNGTRVNGHRVRRAALLPNDQLAFANFRYRLLFGDATAEPTPTDGRAVAAAETDGGTVPAQQSETTPPPLTPVRRNTLPDDYREK
jgi:hypothetical protein